MKKSAIAKVKLTSSLKLLKFLHCCKFHEYSKLA